MKSINLNEIYSFDVNVKDGESHFAGELYLSPNECSLTIRGDILNNRKPLIRFQNIEQITCSCFEGQFIAYGLTPISANNRTLQRHPSPIGHFHIKFNISSVLFTSTSYLENFTFESLVIDSPSISKWVGLTTIQDSIIEAYYEKKLFSPSFPVGDEFLQPIGDASALSIIYQPSTEYSSENFKYSLNFKPLLIQSFASLKNGCDALQIYKKLGLIFSFLIGDSLSVSSVRLITNRYTANGFYLYFPTQNKNTKSTHCFFPLGLNKRVNQAETPELPLNCFRAFFELSNEDRRYFEKYIKYRNINDPEERFLGFFRLLEKLCYQKEQYVDEIKLKELIDRAKPFLEKFFNKNKGIKSLLKRVIKINENKLNTATNINKFIDCLPETLSNSLIYNKENTDFICKVRNDLTHANEYEPNDYEIINKAKYIELLLVMKLLQKIEIPIEISSQIISRLNDYYYCKPFK